MIKKLLFFVFVIGVLISCNKENLEATIPAYVHIDSVAVQSNFNQTGSASHRITTVWIYLDDKIQGTYELPCDFPIIASGKHKLTVVAGIDLNGISAYKLSYPNYNFYSETIDFVPEKTHYLNTAQDSIPLVSYGAVNSFNVLENFENIGLSFQETPKSDTAMFKTTDLEEVFALNAEPTQGSGKVILPSGFLFETATIASFELPKYGSDVYIELDYKCDIPFTVGIFANSGAQTIQAPVVTVNPSEKWNKIYINLVTEVSGYPEASDFNIFIGSQNTSATTRTLFFDNIKLIY